MPKSYVDRREYFSEWELRQAYAASSRSHDGYLSAWLDAIEIAKCPTCSVLTWIPYDGSREAYAFGRMTITHELGCPIG